MNARIYGKMKTRIYGKFKTREHKLKTWEQLMAHLRRTITDDGEETDWRVVVKALALSGFTCTSYHPTDISVNAVLGIGKITTGTAPSNIEICESPAERFPITPSLWTFYSLYGYEARPQIDVYTPIARLPRPYLPHLINDSGIRRHLLSGHFRMLLLKDSTKGTYHLISTTSTNIQTALRHSFSLRSGEVYDPSVET